MTKQELINELNNFRNMEFLEIRPNMDKIEYFRLRRVDYNNTRHILTAVWYFEDLDCYVKFESTDNIFIKCYEINNPFN
jgi:hypothetical protein